MTGSDICTSFAHLRSIVLVLPKIRAIKGVHPATVVNVSTIRPR